MQVKVSVVVARVRRVWRNALGEDLGEVLEELALVLGVELSDGLEDLVGHEGVVGGELDETSVSGIASRRVELAREQRGYAPS